MFAQRNPANAASHSAAAVATIAQAPTPAGGLAQRVDSARRAARTPVWLRYETDSTRQVQGMCQNGNWGNGGEIDLDSEDRGRKESENGNNHAAGRIAVYLRVENQTISRVETYGTGCTVKASASTLQDLGTASATEGVALLRGLMTPGQLPEKAAKRIVFSVAMHASPEADSALHSWTSATWPMAVRRDAAFWMGSARGNAGFSGLQQLMRESSDADLRKHAVFAISLHRSEDGTRELLRIAKEDEQTEVRKAAVFWLSQHAGKAAVSGLESIAENDPDAKLREHAVFALSQLPDEQGVAKLISLAKTHRDPGVRKKAIFWLSQKSDPRVLSFFEEVLTSKNN